MCKKTKIGILCPLTGFSFTSFELLNHYSINNSTGNFKFFPFYNFTFLNKKKNKPTKH